MDEMPGRFPPPPEPPPGAAPQSVAFPLRMERVIQLTFSLFGFRPAAFVAVALVILLPAHVLLAIANLAIVDDLVRIQQAQLDLSAGAPVDLLSLLSPAAIALDYLAILVIAVVGYLAQAALVHMADATYRGAPAGIGGSLRAAFGRLGSVTGAAVLVLLATFGATFLGGIIGVGLILLSVSGGQIQPGLTVFAGLVVLVATFVLVIFLGIRWTFVAQSVMVDRLGSRASLGRSWRLVSGSSWRVLGYTLLFALITGVIALFISTVVAIFAGTGFRVIEGQVTFVPVAFLISTLIDVLISIALTPISVIGLTLLYFDLRVRKGERLAEGSASE